MASLTDLRLVRRYNKQSKETSRHISYLAKMIKTVQRSRKLDTSTYNPKSVALSTRPLSNEQFTDRRQLCFSEQGCPPKPESVSIANFYAISRRKNLKWNTTFILINCLTVYKMYLNICLIKSKMVSDFIYCNGNPHIFKMTIYCTHNIIRPFCSNWFFILIK